MAIKFTIGKRIGWGFAALIISTLLVYVVTTITLEDSIRVNQNLTEKYFPSIRSLQKFEILIANSKGLINTWANQQTENTVEKQALLKLHELEYPAMKLELDSLAHSWSQADKDTLHLIIEKLDLTFAKHKEVMNALNSFESYEDAMTTFMVEPLVRGGEIDSETDAIVNMLRPLTLKMSDFADDSHDEMVNSFVYLELIVYISGTILVLAGIVIAFFTARSIVKPVYKLRDTLYHMAKGVLPKGDDMTDRSDEIGEMALALKEHKDGLERTIEFSNHIGSGNFEEKHTPLSDEDTLGHTLLKMRDDLKDLTHGLEELVRERTEEVVQQKEIIEEKNEHITASINYAKRIQSALLPQNDVIEKLKDELFILYHPRDIVSGDFYWIHRIDDEKYLIAAVDCTGHGIPGAFMSLIGYNLLNRIVSRGTTAPNEILSELNRQIQYALKQKQTMNLDGMDMVLALVDHKSRKIQFSGAKNPVIYVKNGEVTQVKGDKNPIGGAQQEEHIEFNLHEIDIDSPIHFYMFSDGYQDQFGGENDRKFGIRTMRQNIHKRSVLPLKEQYLRLETDLQEWMKETNQIDDILVIGMRIE